MALKHSNPTRPRIDRRGRKYVAYAPYNFVPLPERMVESMSPLRQDVYHKEGVTGWIDCELETCSPVYVRGMLDRKTYEEIGQKEPAELTVEEKEQLAPFFATKERMLEGSPRPVIPGSTIRGMIRSLVEMIAHGRIRWVSPSPTFTFRAVAASSDDPLQQSYREAIGNYGSKVQAGYLEKRGEDWYIRPAKKQDNWPAEDAYLKVRENQISGKGIPGYIRFDSPNYRPLIHPVSFDAEISERGRASLVKIQQIGSREKGYRYKGTLVCSGNMLETGKALNKKSPRRKHALILPPADEDVESLRIPKQVIEDYRNGLTPFQKEHLTAWSGKDCKAWGCLAEGKPVFYVAEGNEVQYFGHSPNFRIPARLYGSNRAATPQDFVPEDLRDLARSDFADAIFGWVEEDDGLKSQTAGRVFFSDARCTGATNGIWQKKTSMTPHTLSNPKPTTFQHYLVQDRKEKHDPDEKSTLAHYGTSLIQSQIRGHKMYWHKGRHPDLEATEKEHGHPKQLTRMTPIRPGVKFAFRIYFENLRKEEVGALWWAVTLPGEPGKTYRHKLGMGKPLGMGTVTITARLSLTDRKERYDKLFNDSDSWNDAARTADAQPFVKAFEKYVLNELGLGLEKSRLYEVERIRMLLSMLSWPGPSPAVTRYLEIEHPENGNEYKERPVLPDPTFVLKESDQKQVVATDTIERDSSKIRSGYQKGTVLKFGLGSHGDFGFIQPDGGGPDVFVHKSHLSKGLQTLSAGARVRYKAVKGHKGLQARNVEVVE